MDYLDRPQEQPWHCGTTREAVRERRYLVGHEEAEAPEGIVKFSTSAVATAI